MEQLKLIKYNYEFFEKIINNKNKKILTIFKNIVNNQVKNQSIDTTIKEDKFNVKYIKIQKNCRLYQNKSWFYPSTYQFTNDIKSNYFYSKYTASLLSLYTCGGIHTFKLVETIKLIVVDKEFIKNIIKEYIDPLLKTSKFYNYYYYIKIFLRLQYGMASNYELQEIKEIKKMEIFGDHCTSNFIIYISKIKGYNGVIYLKNEGIYNLIENSYKIVLNNYDYIKRDNNNEIDWVNWEIKDYILPIEEFIFNSKNFSIYENRGFRLYNFYKSSLLPSIKITKEYDFGLINVNNFISINKLHSKNNCIEGLIKFIKTHCLKFVCIQNFRYGDRDCFNKLLSIENLYSSLGDYEQNFFSKDDLCNVVISTSSIIILDNKITKNKEHIILFKHPNYKNRTFMNINVNNVLQFNYNMNADYVLGDFGIIKGSESYKKLENSGYALNSEEIYDTNPDKTQTDYILSKIPNILKSCVAMNYKYSTHKFLIGALE